MTESELLNDLLCDLVRMDMESTLPDGDSIPVNVALWAGEWAKRIKEVMP